MIRNRLEQCLEQFDFLDDVILYYNEDNLMETGEGACLNVVLQMCNPNDDDLIYDISRKIEANFSIVDWKDLDGFGAVITIDPY